MFGFFFIGEIGLKIYRGFFRDLFLDFPLVCYKNPRVEIFCMRKNQVKMFLPFWCDFASTILD
jgi:hypothetical protein